MNKRTELPSQEDLLCLFSYDPESGILTRRCDGRIPACRSAYVYVRVNGHSVLAHRVIWKMMTGDEPWIIDHKDCDGKNNKWNNLRSAEHKENLRNRGAPKSNTSGIKGVSFCKATGLWRASIMVDYRAINLGRYSTIAQATEAHRVASEKMHGEFSRTA